MQACTSVLRVHARPSQGRGSFVNCSFFAVHYASASAKLSLSPEAGSARPVSIFTLPGRNLSLVAPPPEAGADLASSPSRGLSDGLPPSPSSHSPVYRQPDWLLCNDFCIMPCAPAEVVTLFGNQKVPCLLYYSRVSLPGTHGGS